MCPKVPGADPSNTCSQESLLVALASEKLLIVLNHGKQSKFGGILLEQDLIAKVHIVTLVYRYWVRGRWFDG